MNVDLIGSTVVSVTKVIKTMASIEVKRGKALKKSGSKFYGDITGIIGLVAPNAKGSLAISFSQKSIMEIMSAMLGEEITELNDEVADCVGELTNMIAGGAKKFMSEKGIEFGMATPMIVSGKNHSIIHEAMDNNVSIPFKTSTGTFIVEVCYKIINTSNPKDKT